MAHLSCETMEEKYSIINGKHMIGGIELITPAYHDSWDVYRPLVAGELSKTSLPLYGRPESTRWGYRYTKCGNATLSGSKFDSSFVYVCGGYWENYMPNRYSETGRDLLGYTFLTDGFAVNERVDRQVCIFLEHVFQCVQMNMLMRWAGNGDVRFVYLPRAEYGAPIVNLHEVRCELGIIMMNPNGGNMGKHSCQIESVCDRAMRVMNKYGVYHTLASYFNQRRDTAKMNSDEMLRFYCQRLQAMISPHIEGFEVNRR